MPLCRADSAVISILEPGGNESILRLHAAAGALAPNLGRTMPLEACPCETVIARGSVLLFNGAGRFFPALTDNEPRIYESLLAPLRVEGEAVGTLWALNHTREQRFDAEDARVLASLAQFASAAFRMNSAMANSRQAHEELERRVEERTKELSRSNERLSASEERFRRAMSIGTVGVLFFTLDGRMTHANEAFERMSGYRRDELFTLDWRVLTPTEFMEATALAAGELAARGETAPYEKEHIRKDGSRWWGLFAPTRTHRRRARLSMRRVHHRHHRAQTGRGRSSRQ